MNDDTGARTAAGTKRPTRRSFLKLVAAGSAAIMTGAVAPLARAASAPTRRRRGPVSPAMKAEIANQKAYLDRTLKILREYELPAGSDPAFVFRPLPRRAARGEHSR